MEDMFTHEQSYHIKLGLGTIISPCKCVCDWGTPDIYSFSLFRFLFFLCFSQYSCFYLPLAFSLFSICLCFFLFFLYLNLYLLFRLLLNLSVISKWRKSYKNNKTPSVLKYCIAIVFMPSTTCKCLCIKCGLKWNWTILLLWLLLFAVILTSAVDHCCESSTFCSLICNKYLWNLTSFIVFIVFKYAIARLRTLTWTVCWCHHS